MRWSEIDRGRTRVNREGAFSVLVFESLNDLEGNLNWSSGWWPIRIWSPLRSAEVGATPGIAAIEYDDAR